MPDSFGLAGKWVHDRAHSIMEKGELGKTYGKKDAKSVAYAIATQQAHKVGKSPKGFRTPEGVREAKRKHHLPMKEYQKTAGVGSFLKKLIKKPKMSVKSVSSPRPVAKPVGQTKISPIQGIKGSAVRQHVQRQAAAGGKRIMPWEGVKAPMIKTQEFEKAAETTNYSGPIEKQTEDNTYFRKVLSTNKHSQLVLMTLKPGEEIGVETHPTIDQFFRIEAGKAAVVRNGNRVTLEDGGAFIVPAGTEHNVINASETEPLKVYTIYSPPNHPPGTVHKTKEEAMQAEKEKTANGEEESSTPGKKVPVETLKSFFKKNPAATDEQVHELAEAHGTDPHTMETQIYGILGKELNEKTAMLYGFFDELEDLEKDAGALRKMLLGGMMAAGLAGGAKSMAPKALASVAKGGIPAITQMVKKAPKSGTRFMTGGGTRQVRGELARYMP